MSVAGRDIFTVGHSTHKLEAFIGLLKQHGVTAIADVRSQPFSRLAEYNRDALSAALKRESIQYVPLGRELGARRDEPECYIDGQAVYERVAQLPLFHEGIERLLKGAKRFTIALMCAEKEPLNCHRTVLVCRHLRSHGLHIRHILADGTLEEHAAAEKRLMKMMRIAPDLFQQDVKEEDLIERAYKERGKQIAYRMNTEGASMNEPTSSTYAKPITIFTIGFAGKTAQEFFEKLQKAGVKRMIDVRLNNVSQLAGFTKRKDLEYFLRVIADIGYAHFDDLAPTKDILDSFKKQKEMDWTDYERRFNALMEQRSPETHHLPDEFDQGCLLCSEATPENCHRRLVAEHLRRKWGNVVIKHL